MNSSATLGYQLPTFTGLISHSWSRSMLLRDREERDILNDHEVDVQVRSGDYFVTLATNLDRLGDKVANHDARLDIEDVVSDLIYLQDHYTISKKHNSTSPR